MKKSKLKKRKRSGLVELVNGALTLFILAVVVVVGVLMYGAHLFYTDGNLAEDTTFQVKRGAGLATIASQLEDSGVVSSKWVFQAGTAAQKKERALKAGEYRIASRASMADVLKELTEGNPITYSVTIPEGFTSWQIAERLRADVNLTGEIEAIPGEGTLLPNTYVYERGTARADILDLMKKAHADEVAKIWESRADDLPISTPEELVILASVVEKETGIATERPEVAAVFVNRLNKGMRLQSDPTIIYGITNGEGPLGRGLKRSEIRAETPYNTYVVNGLPVGPIANPGIESLRATANPATTKALYFVAAGALPSQGHLFANSYAEHQKNVAAYRQALRTAAAAQEKQAADAARSALESLEAEQEIEAEQAENPPTN